MASTTGRRDGTTIEDPAGGSGRPAAPADDLTLFAAVVCALLRQVARSGWLARETVEGTRAVAQLAADLHRRSAGFSLVVAQDHFRHRESGDKLAADGRALVRLLRLFQRRGLREVRFAADVTPLAIRNLLRVLLEPATDIAATLPPGCGVEAVALRADTPAVVLLRDDGTEAPVADLCAPEEPVGCVADPLARPARPGAPATGTAPAVPGRSSALEGEVQRVRRENADIREAVAGMITTGERPPRPAILTAIEAMEQDEHLTYLLASLRHHDAYTFNHCCNVALLATAVARHLGVAGADLRRFAAAVLLHDVGKLYTPLTVLNKPGKFAPDEWQAMRRHPPDGMDILVGAGFENAYSERVTLVHHVAYDGSGYPATSGVEPDLYSQIVQVADVYDAFTTIRPYRQQARPPEVLQLIRKEAGRLFNPGVVDAVHALMGETPIGSVLKLDNGQLGLVVDMGSTAENRPIVRVIQDEFGNRPATPALLDLSARLPATGEYMVDVVEAVDPVIRNIPIGRYI